MAVFSGCFWALGTGISNAGVFTEATTYTRPAVSTTGTALSGLTQNVAQITGPTGPVGGTITKGAIFDSLTGGNCLAYWDWTVLTAVPANFLAVTANIVFNSYLQSALNMALTGGQGTTGSLIDAGAQVGTLNGQPMIAATRLNIAPGGNLTAHLGSGQWIGSAEVQNTLSFGSLASGNILNGITALAGGANSALTPVLTGFINRVSTVGTAADSVILPGPTIAPQGAMLVVINGTATAMAIFPDTGASIQGGSANASISMPANTAAWFFRTGSLTWISLPKVPS